MHRIDNQSGSFKFLVPFDWLREPHLCKTVGMCAFHVFLDTEIYVVENIDKFYNFL
jgi:hypothetical protein